MAAKPIDKVLIRKIRFGKKDVRTQPIIIKFDPRAPHTTTRDEATFENCLPSSSFFLFHDMKSKCGGISFQSASNNKQMDPSFTSSSRTSGKELFTVCTFFVPWTITVIYTDGYDIATYGFKSIVEEDVANLTATSEDINETARITRGKNKNPLWLEKRKSLLTAPNFSKAAKSKVELKEKPKAMLHSNFTTDAVQYGLESKAKAVTLYINKICYSCCCWCGTRCCTIFFS